MSITVDIWADVNCPFCYLGKARFAEALAHVRREDLPPALAAAVFICRQPIETPTGKYLGLVHIQKMLRHPPHEAVGIMLDTEVEPLPPEAPLGEVSKLLAAYNLVSVPITDDNDWLIGVVTVDDVLDELLPEDWRDFDDDVTDRMMARSIDG